MGLHDFSVLHHKVETVDDISVVHQRDGGVHHPVYPGFQGRGEQLFRGNVGDKSLTLQGHVVPCLPDMALGKLYRQIGAKGIFVVEGLEVQCIQRFSAPGKRVKMLPPFLNGTSVSADAHGGKNSVPQPLHGLGLRRLGENPLGPGGNGNGRDAPGEAAGHLQTVKHPQCLPPGSLGPDHPA
ncbi:hypothetical protein SDC9_60673 [bioreactor metagenome]|uniref:Uncharacterized protein n=1 Tax=bioreactor metagenome TaxID=1076179 RepID=A0A644XEW7_9ZZZZ